MLFSKILTFWFLQIVDKFVHRCCQIFGHSPTATKTFCKYTEEIIKNLTSFFFFNPQAKNPLSFQFYSVLSQSRGTIQPQSDNKLDTLSQADRPIDSPLPQFSHLIYSNWALIIVKYSHLTTFNGTSPINMLTVGIKRLLIALSQCSALFKIIVQISGISLMNLNRHRFCCLFVCSINRNGKSN